MFVVILAAVHAPKSLLESFELVLLLAQGFLESLGLWDCTCVCRLLDARAIRCNLLVYLNQRSALIAGSLSFRLDGVAIFKCRR